MAISKQYIPINAFFRSQFGYFHYGCSNDQKSVFVSFAMISTQLFKGFIFYEKRSCLYTCLQVSKQLSWKCINHGKALLQIFLKIFPVLDFLLIKDYIMTPSLAHGVNYKISSPGN